MLSELKADNVSSIGDTTQSTQVATKIKTTFFDLQVEDALTPSYKLLQLDGLGDTTKPTHMQIPDRIADLCWVMYDTRTSATDTRVRFTNMDYVLPDEFIERTKDRNSDDSTVSIVTDFDGTSLLIRLDKNPEYFTSLDEKYLVFDSYDSDIDDTLQTSKTLARVEEVRQFTLTDGFVLDLPDKLFQWVYNEALSRCFNDLKEEPNAKAEQRARKANSRLRRSESKLTGLLGQRSFNFGRTPTK